MNKYSNSTSLFTRISENSLFTIKKSDFFEGMKKSPLKTQYSRDQKPLEKYSNNIEKYSKSSKKFSFINNENVAVNLKEEVKRLNEIIEEKTNKEQFLFSKIQALEKENKILRQMLSNSDEKLRKVNDFKLIKNTTNKSVQTCSNYKNGKSIFDNNNEKIELLTQKLGEIESVSKLLLWEKPQEITNEKKYKEMNENIESFKESNKVLINSNNLVNAERDYFEKLIYKINKKKENSSLIEPMTGVFKLLNIGKKGIT